MGSWRTRASAASVAGAFVFAAVAGAGSMLVGNWWGQHHGPVVTEYVTTPASPGPGGHHGPATSVRPATASPPSAGAASRGVAQADAKTAREAGTSPAAVRTHRPARPAAPAPASIGPATVPPASPSAAPATPTASGAGSTPSGTPSATDSPGTDRSTS
jgi:hypothetical protein